MYEMTGPHVSSVPVPACAGRRRTRTNRRPWARAQKQTHCPVGPPSHRSPEGNLRAVWSRAVVHLATRRPPGFARPAEPSSTGRSEDPPAASGSPNRLPPGDPRVVWLRAVRWSRSWPSGPKTARPVRTPGVTRHPVIRRSPGLVPLHRHTGPGHPQGCPQPVHRWRSSTANPRVCDGFPPGNRNPTARRPAGSPDPITRSEHRPQTPVSRASRLLRLPFGVGVPRCDGRFLLPPRTPHKGLRRRSSRSFRPSTGRGWLSPGRAPSSTRSPTS